MALKASAQLWSLALRAYGRVPHFPGKWRAIPAGLFLRTQPLWDRPVVVRRRGVTYELDLNDYLPRYLYFTGSWEPWETRTVERLVRPGATVVDVGAHLGYYTMLMSRLVGPRGVVHAFEPTPATFARLSRTLALNGPPNVRAYQIALGDVESQCRVVTRDLGNTGKNAVDVAAGGPIPVTTLDRFAHESGLQRLDFMKVDIEGSEARFLAGAWETLQRFRPHVLLEVNRPALLRYGISPRTLIERFAGIGYSLTRVGWRSGPVRSRDLERDHEFNVVASPRESVATARSSRSGASPSTRRGSAG